MIKYETIKTLDEDYVLQTYKRMPALFVQGAGCSLWDNRGNEYLDLLAGIGVCSLGHCHPAVVAAISRQAQQLMHTSNLFLTAPAAQLAAKLCEISGFERVWFGVCGATANEAAIKIAKKFGNGKCPDGDYQIICLNKSFHGRTMGAVSATGQRKYQISFEPIVPGFVHIDANDIEALREVFSDKTAAILVEPIMGEGGVTALTTEFLREAEALCEKHNALLMVDEVQCGMGRTGDWFTFQSHGIQPHVMCLAKALGGGMPIGATLVRGKATGVLEIGDHGSTFGGSAIMCAAGLAVLDTMEHQDVLANVRKVGQYFADGLRALGDIVTEVTGKGLMLGAKLSKPIARDIVRDCFEKHLIINATDESTLRFVPPLILTEAQVDHALSIIAEVIGVEAPPKKTHVESWRVKSMHDVLSIDDLSTAQIEEVLSLAAYQKERRRIAPSIIQPVENRTVALVFEKPSLRTRLSFETAIRELGGHPVYLSKADIGMGQRESIKDVASNLSRWCSMIVARLYWQRHLVELAEAADVPVINALTEMEHPCQALADLLTVRENFGDQKVKITYVGDGNNVARSLAKAATRLGYPMTICGPENFRMEEMQGLMQTSSLEEGLADAHVVYTDVWISMGDEHEQEHRLKIFDSYQVNDRVMQMAAKDAIFLHCLPARRDFEVTDSVIDGKQSRVVDQAENRLHAQKALLQKAMGL